MTYVSKEKGEGIADSAEDWQSAGSPVITAAIRAVNAGRGNGLPCEWHESRSSSAVLLP